METSQEQSWESVLKYMTYYQRAGSKLGYQTAASEKKSSTSLTQKW
jgi:hypothetical protein